jgi:hypothetical protein
MPESYGGSLCQWPRKRREKLTMSKTHYVLITLMVLKFG